MFNIEDIMIAYDFVSTGVSGDARVVLDKKTGKLHYESVAAGEEIEEDLDWEDCVEVPDKYDLDLGNQLVFDFVRQHMPDEYDRVSGYFRSKGAFRRFKDLLESQDLLEVWYGYEDQRVEESLRRWCEANGVELEN
ncbi:MAG TPA: hypothetical protein VKA68_18905 [bacterium]|nr:hypothetical protein [bacterium]